MADQATQQITVEATPERCFEVVTDFERYPEWATDVKEATVVERDAQGRPVEVDFRAAAMGRSTRYQLRYDLADAPAHLSWSLTHGDITKAIDGSYDFVPGAAPGTTDVTYRLSIDLVLPLPGFVKRRAEVKILNTIRELKARVEG
jgi:ribosome-associated toxin RatA of RatAB toxin-antitoxin module